MRSAFFVMLFPCVNCVVSSGDKGMIRDPIPKIVRLFSPSCMTLQPMLPEPKSKPNMFFMVRYRMVFFSNISKMNRKTIFFVNLLVYINNMCKFENNFEAIHNKDYSVVKTFSQRRSRFFRKRARHLFLRTDLV